MYGLRRRVEGVKERALIGADNPVVHGDVKRGGEETRRDETGWNEMDEEDEVRRGHELRREREKKEDGKENRTGIKPGKTKPAGRR